VKLKYYWLKWLINGSGSVVIHAKLSQIRLQLPIVRKSTKKVVSCDSFFCIYPGIYFISSKPVVCVFSFVPKEARFYRVPFYATRMLMYRWKLPQDAILRQRVAKRGGLYIRTSRELDHHVNKLKTTNEILNVYFNIQYFNSHLKVLT
jgi:hypothetical protein